jgi:hypothetical protein
MPIKDTKVLLVAELGLQDRILQEQSPGTCARAPGQKRPQSGCRHSPHQLGDGKLAVTNKAKAANQVESPMPGLSLARLPFCEEKSIPLEPSQKVSRQVRNGTKRNISQK